MTIKALIIGFFILASCQSQNPAEIKYRDEWTFEWSEELPIRMGKISEEQKEIFLQRYFDVLTRKRTFFEILIGDKALLSGVYKGMRNSHNKKEIEQALIMKLQDPSLANFQRKKIERLLNNTSRFEKDTKVWWEEGSKNAPIMGKRMVKMHVDQLIGGESTPESLYIIILHTQTHTHTSVKDYFYVDRNTYLTYMQRKLGEPISDEAKTRINAVFELERNQEELFSLLHKKIKESYKEGFNREQWYSIYEKNKVVGYMYNRSYVRNNRLVIEDKINFKDEAEVPDKSLEFKPVTYNGEHDLNNPYLPPYRLHAVFTNLTFFPIISKSKWFEVTVTSNDKDERIAQYFPYNTTFNSFKMKPESFTLFTLMRIIPLLPKENRLKLYFFYWWPGRHERGVYEIEYLGQEEVGHNKMKRTLHKWEFKYYGSAVYFYEDGKDIVIKTQDKFKFVLSDEKTVKSQFFTK